MHDTLLEASVVERVVRDVAMKVCIARRFAG